VAEANPDDPWTILYGSTPLTDQEAAALRARHLDARHFQEPLGGPGGEPTDVYRPDGEPLLVYRPRVGAVLEELGPALPALRAAARWSHLRQAASGTVGFLDHTPLEPYCRATRFTRDRPGAWATLLPLLGALDAAYQAAAPDRHAAQSGFARRTCQDYVIPGTCFTTATVNDTHRFVCHRDKGNLANGLGVMTVWRPGGADYRGGQLVFPQWRLAVDMMAGDVLVFDGREWHGNAPIEPVVGSGAGPVERISVVCYYRRRMLRCGTPDLELEAARRRLSGGGPRPGG
jgi:hypothetical protein